MSHQWPNGWWVEHGHDRGILAMIEEMTMRKKIIISIAALLGVAVLVFGALFVIQLIRSQNEETPPAETLVGPNLSKNYGACDLFDKATVKTALGSAANELQDPQNNGIVDGKKVGGGMEDLVFDSQVCIYGFAPGGTFEDGSGSGNGLTVLVAKYTNETGPATFIAAIRDEPLIEEITDLGDDAFYNANTTATGPGAMYNFKLQVFKGKTLYEYTIRQPADAATYTAESAKTALVTLAKAAKD